MNKKWIAVLALALAPMAASAYALTGGKWGTTAVGTGATITWSLMPTGTSCVSLEGSGCAITALADFMPPGYLTQIQAAFAAWSAVANVTFVQVTDDGSDAEQPSSHVGDIRIGGHAFSGPGGVLAHAYFPDNGTAASAGVFGDIHVDTAEAWTTDTSSSSTGIQIFNVLAHEIGHSLGLDHTSVPGSLMNEFYSTSLQGPQADDIAGVQYLYGAAVTTTDGGDVPEPSSWALVGLGAALVGLRRQRAPRRA